MPGIGTRLKSGFRLYQTPRGRGHISTFPYALKLRRILVRFRVVYM